MTAVLIAGGGGRLGRALVDRFRLDFPGLQINAPAHEELDASDPEAVAAAVAALRPLCLFNAAGFTNVGAARGAWEAALRANAAAPATLADAALASDAYFVHFSTDYVFSGKGRTPWTEVDAADPLGAYGLSKRLGEEAVIARFNRGLAGVVIRVGWLYGSGDAREFPARILTNALAGEPLWVRTDQTGKPTSYRALAELSSRLLARRLHEAKALPQDLLHFVQPGPYVSRFELARFILERGAWHAAAMGRREEAARLKSAAARLDGGPLAGDLEHPANCRLGSGKLKKLVLSDCYPWKVDVDNFVENFLDRQLSTGIIPSLTSQQH